jgi:uncharacterized membrane protein
MELKISLALHLIGMVMWLGSLLVLTRLFKLFTSPITSPITSPSGPQGQLPTLMGRMLWGYVIPGFLLSLGTGLYQMGYVGFGTYLAQGWFHGKLTLVVLLVVVTLLCFANVGKIRRGAPVSGGLASAMHGFVGFTLIVVVLMTVKSGMYFAGIGTGG